MKKIREGRKKRWKEGRKEGGRKEERDSKNIKQYKKKLTHLFPASFVLLKAVCPLGLSTDKLKASNSLVTLVLFRKYKGDPHG